MNSLNFSRLDKSKQTTVMLHLGNGKLNINHFRYWYEVFKDSSVGISFLTRDLKSFNKLIELYPNEQILYAKSPIDVETIINIQDNLKAVFYTINMAKNIHLLRFSHLTHIFIGSKNSDYLSAINKSYRAYDEIWVSSQFMIDKFKNSISNLGHLKFSIIGKPQLKNIISQSISKKRAITYLTLKKDKSETLLNHLGVILLKTDYSSCVYIKNKSYINYIEAFAFERNLNIELFQDREMVVDCMLQSCFIAVDINHISVELLAYNCPILVFVPKNIDINILELDIPKEVIYFFSNGNEYIDLIKKLEKEDSLFKERERLMEYFLGKESIMNNIFFEKLNKWI